MVTLGLLIALILLQPVIIGGLIWAISEIKGMQKSTHSIQYVPADKEFQKVTDDIKENLTKDIFDNVV